MDSIDETIMNDSMESIGRSVITESNNLAYRGWVKIHGPDNLEAFALKVKTSMERVFENIIAENVQTEKNILATIQRNFHNKAIMEKILGEEMELPSPDGLPLMVFCNKVAYKLKECHEKFTRLKPEVEKLIAEEKDLCAELHRVPVYRGKAPTWPNEKERSEMKKHIELMKQFILAKENEMRAADDTFRPSMESTMIADEVSQELEKFTKKFKSDLDESLTNAKRLWRKLNIPLAHQRTILYGSAEGKTAKIELATFDRLQAEILRCEELYTEKIIAGIEIFRSDIITMAAKCMKGDSFRDSSIAYKVTPYSEEVLLMHNSELQLLNKFYNKNEAILQLILQHNDLSRKVKTLKAAFEGKVEFYNPDRKKQEIETMQAEFKSIQASLTKALAAYEIENAAHFVVFDKIVVQLPGTKNCEASAKTVLSDRTNRV